MLHLRKATHDDIPIMQEIFKYAREYMRNNGNGTQWKDNRPPLFLIERDLMNEVSYIVYNDEEVVGTFSYLVGDEPTYQVIDGAWLNDYPYGTIHRIASNGKAKGVFKFCLDFCLSFGVDIKIDTHENNKTMLYLIEKYGFVYCGKIIIDDGTSRLAFQKLVNR